MSDGPFLFRNGNLSRLQPAGEGTPWLVQLVVDLRQLQKQGRETGMLRVECAQFCDRLHESLFGSEDQLAHTGWFVIGALTPFLEGKKVVDGFFCCLLSYLRGFITMDTVNRVFRCMQVVELPTTSSYFTSELAWQSCKDAVEHRHGAQRIPMIT